MKRSDALRAMAMEGLPEVEDPAGKLTPLQRSRLKTALAKIALAGGDDAPGHLQDRLRRSMLTGSDGQWPLQEVFVQARAWASIVRTEDHPDAKAEARDAIGLLWASMEDPPW